MSATRARAARCKRPVARTRAARRPHPPATEDVIAARLRLIAPRLSREPGCLVLAGGGTDHVYIPDPPRGAYPVLHYLGEEVFKSGTLRLFSQERQAWAVCCQCGHAWRMVGSSADPATYRCPECSRKAEVVAGESPAVPAEA